VRRWLPWVLLGLVVAGALAVGTPSDGPPTTDERVRAVAATVRCPTCRSQSVRDSDAPAAEYIRAEIRRQVEGGQTDDDIRAFLVSRYGQSILLTPPRSGVAALVWVLPVAGLVAAVAGLAVAFRRWRPAAVDVADDDRVIVERARRRGRS
jgi:cytochrome c-type biogenesis protein CcmH